MKYMVDKPLRDFEFWSGAVDTAKQLDYDGFSNVEDILEQMQADRVAGGGQPMTETEINDMFWFESDTILQWAGVYPKYYSFKSKVFAHDVYVKLADEGEIESFRKACNLYGVESEEVAKDDYPDDDDAYDWDANAPTEIFWEERSPNFEYSYEVPASWPAVIENDDFTGVNDDEEKEIREFMEEVSEYRNSPDYFCVWGDEVGFGKPDFGYGDKAGDCITFRIYSR